MEIIKRTVLLEDTTYRGSGSTTTICDVQGNYGNNIRFNTTKVANWGQSYACSFYIPISLTQTLDDIGIYTPMEFIPKQRLTNVPNNLMNIGRLPGLESDMFYDSPKVITGDTTDEWLLEVISPQETYAPMINQCSDCKDDNGNWIRFDGVLSYNATTKVVVYVIGGEANPASGSYIQNTGIIYTTKLDDWITEIDPETQNTIEYRKTTFSFTSKGRNVYNTTLSANTKQEEFLGIVFPQEVQSEVFIERGGEDIFEKHMIMAEIKTVDDIDDYRNGYLVNRI